MYNVPFSKQFSHVILCSRERMTAEECLSHPWLNPGGSPLPGICLTLSPEGATDDTPPSSPARGRNTSSSDSPSSPKTTKTGEGLLCGSEQDPSPNNGHLVQSNGTSGCKTTLRGEDSNIISTSDQRDSSSGVAQNVSPETPLSQCNGTSKTTMTEDPMCKSASNQEPSPNVYQKTPLLQSNGYCKLNRSDEDCNSEKDNRLFCKSEQRGQCHEPSPHKSPLMQRNGTSSCNSVGAFCKTTRTEEDNRLFCKSTSEPSHIVHHTKSPLLQRNATGVGAFCKTTMTEEDNENDSRVFCKRDSSHEPSPGVARKSPLLQRNGAFCKLGDTVTQSSSFCQSSVLQRHSESKTTTSFSKNNSSGIDQGSGVTKESKSRSVDMVVSQFEGMSKRIVFSEEIIVDERVGMVY